MTRSVTGANVTREQEIGLRLPDGAQIFPPDTWHDHPLGTADERDYILTLIKNAAKSLGYPEGEFLERYAWVGRDKITATMYETGDEFPIFVTGKIDGFATDYEGAHPDLPGINGEVFESTPPETVQTPSVAD